MKKIIKSLFVVAVMVVLVAGATQAMWTDEGEIKNNQFTTGNADLDLWDVDAAKWKDNINSFRTDNIYPGWTESYNFKLMNNSKSDIPLKVTVNLKDVDAHSFPDLKSNTYLYFTEKGSTTPLTWKRDLNWWENTSGHNVLGTLNQGDEGKYTAHFELDENAGNTFMNQKLNFVVHLTGTQQ